MSFEITILGSGSASPRVDRLPSAHHIRIHNHNFLIDCGEGTQFRMISKGLSIQKLDYILVTHLHGDHIFGLIGLISTLAMWDRHKKLQIFSPPGLRKTIDAQLDYSKAPLCYELEFIELDAHVSQTIIDEEHFLVKTVPLAHGIECVGYMVEEKPRLRNLIKEKLPAHMSIKHLRALKNGEDIMDEKGAILYKNEDYTFPEQERYSYAYLSDTKYLESVAPIIHGVTLLYHEATFLEEQRQRAEATLHSTAIDAAKIAQLAHAKRLIIGHFSSRYETLEKFKEEGQTYFENLDLAYDGMQIVLREA